MKRVTLCADDFALSQAGSQRILQLLELGRLSATSVMSQSRHWPQLAAALGQHSNHADIGLHFNLTEPFDHRVKPLSYWLLVSQLRLLSKEPLKQMLREQLERFSQALQRLPDFIDGHQHVHAFPVVRQALFEVIDEYWSGQVLPYVRAPDRLADAGDAAFKGLVLKASCVGFNQQLARQGLRAPAWFAGLYSLRAEAGVAELMQRWLAQAPDQSLIMCHPGVAEAGDAIGPARQAEYEYFMSRLFSLHCEQGGVVVSTFHGKTP